MRNPFQDVKDFEAAISEYTGAPYVVCVNSCTAALLLALEYWGKDRWEPVVDIPRRTYPSVPMSAWHAGLGIHFTDEEWTGVYQLRPSNVWDCARRFTSGMYVAGQVQCVSFHIQKPLALSCGGGAILHDDPKADEWYRKARYDGRTEGVPTKDDTYTMAGHHCYMFPAQAAEGIHKLSVYPKDAPDDWHPAEYPDLKERCNWLR